MTRKLRWLICIIIIIFFGTLAAWADEQMEIIAPGGAEVDLKTNIMKYHSSGTRMVEAHWSDLRLETKYLEYDRTQMILTGKEQVKITQITSTLKVLKAQQLWVDQKQSFLSASKDVFLKYDSDTSATGDLVEWYQKKQIATITGKAVIIFKDWTLKGNKIEADFNKQVFVAFGPVEIFDKTNLVKGGRLTFDRSVEKVIIQDNPVLIRGNNEMKALEFVYDLKTNQVSANGAVKTRVTNDNK